MAWLGATPADWLSVAAIMTAIAIMARRPRRWRTYAAALLASAAIAALWSCLTVGSRWQMIPAEGVLVVLLTALALSFNPRATQFMRSHVYWRRAAITVLPLLPASALAFSFLLPLFTLPAPTGPFAVGTTRLALTDEGRREMHILTSGKRRLMVGIWYPATPVPGARPQALVPASTALAHAINQANWPFGWLLSHLDRIPTHSIADASLAGTASRLPIVLFSHGLGSIGVQNITLFEALASRGYVVVSIEHSHGNLGTIFTDGLGAAFQSKAYDTQDTPLDPAEEAALTRDVMSDDMARVARASLKVIALMPHETRSSRFWYDYWSADQRFVASTLRAIDAGSFGERFKGRLDLDRIAFAGMSFGGSAAQWSCARDRRCKAGINLDGYRAVMMETPPQTAPFLYFNNRQLNVNRVFLDRDRNRSYWVKIAGSEHFDFSDLPLISPALRWIGLSGTGDPRGVTAIVNTYVLAFLDRHLKGRPAPLLARTKAPWPNVRFVANLPRPPRAKQQEAAQ